MRSPLSAIAISILFLSQFVHAAINEPTEDEMTLMTSRRVSNIVKGYSTTTNNINNWMTSLSSKGVWSDIDMTSGCDARKANWPATEHLTRIRLLTSAYVSNFTDSSSLLNKINLALNYWLDHDFKETDCIDSGGVSNYNCPCGTPGLWNKNWFNQMISVPTYIGDICLLLQEHGLTSKQLMGCKDIQTRSFDRIVGRIRPVSNWTGANLLDVASVGFSMGLLTQNATAVKIALEYFYGGVEISPRVAGDGIQADGSFMQHDGLLYNGNYGQDYMNDLLSVFTETKGTSVAPTLLTQTAFATLMSGTEWMIVSDIKLNLLLWQYSVIGRMVSFKYSDKQASGGVAINFDSVAESAEGWSKQGVIDSIVNRLESPSTGDANQGDLVGTRYFYNADYMIHRAPNYVTTMKMYSSRTVNSECLNNQNPYGFHLSDGAIYNYLTGDEYVDTFGAWNWELVPGITVDTFGTPLSCSTVKTKGKRAFVGGATDGNTGIAVMDYLNPRNGNLAFKKTAFFFPTGYAIQIGSVISKNTTAQLVTVLDQRRRNGDIYVAGKLRNTNTTYATTAGSNSIWHDNIGYYFPTTPEVLYVDSRPRASNWASIGISTGNDQQQLWTAYIKHSAKTETNQGLLTQYVVQPGINATDFNAQVAKGITPISLDFKASSPQVNAAYSAADKSIAVAFWTAGVYTPPWGSTTTIKTNQPCVLLFREIEANTLYRLTVADPSQKLEKVTLTFTVAGKVKSTTAVFPNSINAGKDVVKTITFT